MPTPYTMKFIIMVWLAFLARASPVSTIAKPACMNMTRKPVTSVQTKLVAIRFWPTALTTSLNRQALLRVARRDVGRGAGDRAGRIALRLVLRLLASATPLMSASVIGVAAAAGSADAGAALRACDARAERQNSNESEYHVSHGVSLSASTPRVADMRD